MQVQCSLHAHEIYVDAKLAAQCTGFANLAVHVWYFFHQLLIQLGKVKKDLTGSAKSKGKNIFRMKQKKTF